MHKRQKIILYLLNCKYKYMNIRTFLASAALVNPVWNYYNETVDRVPMSDWVDTIDRTHEAFQARSVVDGLWIKMLAEELL